MYKKLLSAFFYVTKAVAPVSWKVNDEVPKVSLSTMASLAWKGLLTTVILQFLHPVEASKLVL